ncbi:hypothetical protein [Falsigemmobacter faecalis]|uniref:Uncharacterized protein n=1 Tax=Falsigemmobacter faecalis TaxID=2488730 RepID=A0A3P3D122_9RHOB|nr:hypothetical protein [Falsigemmobacter faecalis]RRH68140.1 hypothetical protein EG244_19820 [Falsigemmobacter faecalis]
MRIAWRVSVILLALLHCQGKKASFAKLHVLNDAIRTPKSRESLVNIVEGRSDALSYVLRVEPAFTRALDFVVGEKLAIWGVSSKRTTLILTEAGLKAALAVDGQEDVLVEERAFLSGPAKKLTEGFVNKLLLTGKRLL